MFKLLLLCLQYFSCVFKSETLKLERGAPAERCRLEESRHGAVWCEEVAGEGTVLFVKLSRQKRTDRVVACYAQHVLAIWEM